jgi:hypothetical protein
MMKRIGYLLAIGLACVHLLAPLPVGATSAVGSPATPAATLVAESKDFATQVLRDPWDMNSFSDISLYLNRSGQAYDTQNIDVSNGVFSAQSTNTADTNFSVLFPGYEDTIKTGKQGALFPIDAATYRCLYVAMQVEGSGSQAQAIWYEDDRLNNATFGASQGQFTADSRWIVYYWDLTQAPLYGTSWASRPAWQGLRIDPSNQANRHYAVDWVRLTNCAAVNHTVTWSPNAGVNAIWVRPSGTTRDILAKVGVSGSAGSTQFDVQGLQPGTYTVRLGTTTSCCSLNASNGDLIINQAPTVEFITPSFISGADYATQSGNRWDFADAADMATGINFSGGIGGGLLDTVTQPGPLPAGYDAQVWLNSPTDISGSQYRYLVFRMYAEWPYPWSNVTDGMVARWIWSVPGVSGQPTHRCYLVSHDIPFDIGWQTYVVDLHDAFNSRPEDSSVIDCPGQLPTWANSGPIKDLRFDLNENVTGITDPITDGGPFHQQLDWFRLTAPDRVQRGAPYQVQIELNRPSGDVSSISYYYTTNRSNPTQSAAQRWTPPAAPGNRRIFVPLLANGVGAFGGTDTLPQSDLTFWWNTGGVSPNTYYICAVVSISPNTVTYCSAAPIVVY